MSTRLWLAAGALCLAAALVTGCGPGSAPVSQTDPRERGEAILRALEVGDMEALAGFVHPDKGVRFSPYPYVNPEQDVVLTADEIRTAMLDSRVRTWGAWDGSGEPIEMTFSEYLERFVWDHDYFKADSVSVNESLGQGNSLDNAREVYPDATIIEYYFAGFDPQYEGMDWRALKLVLENRNGQWFLVAIIHGEWTI